MTDGELGAVRVIDSNARRASLLSLDRLDLAFANFA